MTQNSEVSATKRRRGPGRPFRRGVSGNPGGRPRATLDVQALARERTPQAIATLVRALDDERLCVSAALHLLIADGDDRRHPLNSIRRIASPLSC
jgi:hypothetical protein